MLSLQTAYDYGVAIELLLALASFVALFFVTAPYGRHWRTGWGPSLSPRIGWLLMEMPALVLFTGVYFSHYSNDLGTLVLVGLWELHYVHRTLVYPMLMRPGSVLMPVSIVAMGLIFNTINAPLNAIALTYLPYVYPMEFSQIYASFPVSSFSRLV